METELSEDAGVASHWALTALQLRPALPQAPRSCGLQMTLPQQCQEAHTLLTPQV